MTPEAMIKRAHELMLAATIALRHQRKERDGNQRCGCGHRRAMHTVSTSVNFSGGYCTAKDCRCKWFMSNGASVITEPYL